MLISGRVVFVLSLTNAEQSHSIMWSIRHLKRYIFENITLWLCHHWTWNILVNARPWIFLSLLLLNDCVLQWSPPSVECLQWNHTDTLGVYYAKRKLPWLWHPRNVYSLLLLKILLSYFHSTCRFTFNCVTMWYSLILQECLYTHGCIKQDCLIATASQEKTWKILFFFSFMSWSN